MVLRLSAPEADAYINLLRGELRLGDKQFVELGRWPVGTSTARPQSS